MCWLYASRYCIVSAYVCAVAIIEEWDTPIWERRLLKVSNDVCNSVERIKLKVRHVLAILDHASVQKFSLCRQVTQLVVIAWVRTWVVCPYTGR